MSEKVIEEELRRIVKEAVLEAMQEWKEASLPPVCKMRSLNGPELVCGKALPCPNHTLQPIRGTAP